MSFTMQQYYYNLYKSAQLYKSTMHNYIESNYSILDFINDIRKHTHFSSVTINKNLILDIDYTYTKEPFGIYYIEVNGHIQKIDILKYGDEKKIFKDKNAILYYSDNIKIRNKKNLDLSSSMVITIAVILGLSISLIISILNNRTTNSLTFTTLLIFSLFIALYDLKIHLNKKNLEREKNILEIGKMLEKLDINYNYFFLYNHHYNKISLKETKYVLDNKVEELKKHPMFN